MHVAYYVIYRHPDAAARISKSDYDAIVELIKATPKIKRAHIYTPEKAKDIYTDDPPSPIFGMQLDFNSLEDLEAAIDADGHLQKLANGAWASLAPCAVEQQAMNCRPFPVIDAKYQVKADDLPCSYLVHYPGAAKDFGEWINYYLTHHPQIMKDFPKIREIEIFTRVDWLDAMPSSWERVYYMQRNKQIFDSAADLEAAIQSPVRHTMRADFEKFPEFSGSNLHAPMATLILDF